MYLPKHYEVTELAALQDLVRRHPLATWVTVADGLPIVNHVPFWLDAERGTQGTLVGHVARANPIWRAPAPSVLVFQAGDGYVSPSWYPSKQRHGKVVPTWNYAVVHAHGTPRVVEERAALLDIVGRLTDAHEAVRPHPWAVADAPTAYTEQMLNAIVGIELPVERWIGKFKLSQNRDAADRAGVAAAFEGTPMAELMGAARPTYG